jgi:hypothetical protein
VYFKADPSLDHCLKWDMFRLNELEGYDGMITRLLKDELEELVMRSVQISIDIIQKRFTHFNILHICSLQTFSDA